MKNGKMCYQEDFCKNKDRIDKKEVSKFLENKAYRFISLGFAEVENFS